MSCPSCEGDLVCPCKHCAKTRREKGIDAPKWCWIDREIIMCPHCNYAAHADVWEQYSIEELKESEKTKAATT